MKKILVVVLVFMSLIAVGGSLYLIFNDKASDDADTDVAIDWSEITISCIGDSITEGLDLETPYPKALQKELGAKFCYNHGIGWSTCGVVTECDCHPSRPDAHYPMVNRYSRIRTESDIILVMCGVNDAGFVPLGTIDDTVNTTFYGAMNIMCQGLMNRYPNSYLIFMTSFEFNHYDIANSVNRFGAHPKDYYYTAVKEVCAKYNIDVFDTFTEIDFDSARDTIDSVHPTQEFVSKIWVPAIANFIRANYKGKTT